MITAELETLSRLCGEACLRAEQRLAVAESCTGGLLGAALTAIAGSSAYFLGGVISYDNAVKIEVLGVDRNLIESQGAVSEACAQAMAAGAQRLLRADWALSVTGIAGPGGGSDAKPVGTVWIGLASAKMIAARHHLFEGDRATIREQSVEAALLWLLAALGEA